MSPFCGAFRFILSRQRALSIPTRPSLADARPFLDNLPPRAVQIGVQGQKAIVGQIEHLGQLSARFGVRDDARVATVCGLIDTFGKLVDATVGATIVQWCLVDGKVRVGIDNDFSRRSSEAILTGNNVCRCQSVRPQPKIHVAVLARLELIHALLALVLHPKVLLKSRHVDD